MDIGEKLRSGNSFPLPSGVGSGGSGLSGSGKVNLDDSKKSYTLKDLAWAIGVIEKFRTSRELLVEVIKLLAKSDIDTSKINWNDPFSIATMFMELKGLENEIDATEIAEEISKLGDTTFGDIVKAIDIIETYMAISSKIDKIAKVVSKKKTKSEMDMFMSLLSGISGVNSGVKTGSVGKDIDYSDYDEEYSEEFSEDELSKIKEIVRKYREKR